MKMDYTKDTIKKFSNKGLILGLGLSSPMLIVSIYFIWINPFLIVWDVIHLVALLIFLCIVCFYVWKEKTKMKTNIRKIKSSPSNFVYELFGYPGYTFIFAMALAFVLPILSIVFIAIGFWQIYYAKKVIVSKLLLVLQQKSPQFYTVD